MKEKEMYDCFIADSNDIQQKWFLSSVTNNEPDRIYDCFIYEPISGWFLGSAKCKILPKFSKEAKHTLNNHVGKLMINAMKGLDKSISNKVSISDFYETIKCKFLDDISYTNQKINSLVIILDFKKEEAPVNWKFDNKEKGTYYKICIVRP